MLKELDLTTLEERRKQQNLIFFYKVAEGQIPAMPSSDFTTRNKEKDRLDQRNLTTTSLQITLTIYLNSTHL
jgi:hypothetical protein